MTQTQLEELVVKLTADVNGYVKSFQMAQAQTLETTKHIQDATEKVKGFTDSVTSFGQAALAGIAGLGVTRWFKEVFSLAGDTEQQFLGLSAAIKSNTDDVDNTVEAYKRFSEGMFQVTGTSKRTTLALLQMDEMTGLTAKRAMETARQAIALGAATGRDPRSLLTGLNMAQTGSGIQMLRRVPGLGHMTDEAAMVDKANRLMALGMEVSKAQMQSATGMVRKLSEELEEVKKQFGKLLLEALKPGIELLTKTVQWFKDLDERTKLVILSLAGMTVGVVVLVNGLRLLNMATAVLFSGTGGLLAVMLPVAVAASLWAEHLGGVSKAWDLVKEKAQQFWDYVKPVAQATWDVIRIGAMVVANAVILAWEAIKTSFAPIAQFIVAGWHKVEDAATWAANKVGDLWGPLEVAAAAYVATLSAVGAALYWAIPKSFEEMVPLVLRVFYQLASAAAGILPALINSIKEALSQTGEATSTVGSTISSVLSTVGGWINSTVSAISTAAGWIAGVMPKIGEVVKEIAKGAAKFFELMSDAAGIFMKVCQFIQVVIDLSAVLWEHLKNIGRQIADVAVMVYHFLTEATAGLLDHISTVAGKAKEILASIGGFLESLANQIGGTFRGIGDDIASFFSSVFGGWGLAIKESILPALVAIKDHFLSWPKEAQLFTGILAAIPTFKALLGVIKYVSAEYALLSGKIASVGTSLGVAGSKVLYFTKVIGLTVAVIATLASLSRDSSAGLEEVLVSLGKFALFVVVLSKAPWYIAALAGGFELVGTHVASVVAFAASWALFGTRIALTVGVLTELASRSDMVQEAFAAISKYFKELVSGTSIETFFGKVADFFRWIAASISPALRAVGDVFSRLGQSLLAGFELIKNAATEAFSVVQEVAGEVFAALSEVVSNFNWNMQNTVMVVAAAVGVIAAMATFLIAWGVAAKVVAMAMALLTLVMIPNKLMMAAISILYAVFNTLLVFTGIKLLATTIATVALHVAKLLLAVALGAVNLKILISLVLYAALLVALIALASVVVGVVVVAFMAAAEAVMALVEALKTMTLFSGAADAFKHWKGILGGLVTAIQVDMAFAWKYVQDAMHLAGEEVKAYWPPVWERIKEGFSLLWDVLVTKFKAALVKMVIEFQDNTPWFETTDKDRAYLKEKENEAKAAIDRMSEYSRRPLELGNITSPGVEKDLAIVKANIANANELDKLKKAADEEAAALAEKHKKELDTATKLNNLAQQHVELKKAELVVANSADALYKIQAYRVAMQAALEARAARERKDSLDKEPGKGQAQIALETGKAAAMRNEDVASTVHNAQMVSAKTAKEAAEIANQWASKVADEYTKALRAATSKSERAAVNSTLGKQYEEAERAYDRAKKYASPDYHGHGRGARGYQVGTPTSALPQATGQVPPSGGWGSDMVENLLSQIRDAIKDNEKKPVLNVKPVGLK